MLKNVYLGTHMECAGRITIIILASNGQYWCGNRIWNYYQDYFHTTNSYHPINFLSPLINCCTGLPNKKILWSHLETKFFWEQTIAYKHCPLVFASLALAIGCFRKRCEQDEKPKRCFWVWKIYSEESKKRGQWKNLFSELVEDDRECYFNLCISQEKRRITETVYPLKSALLLHFLIYQNVVDNKHWVSVFKSENLLFLRYQRRYIYHHRQQRKIGDR